MPWTGRICDARAAGVHAWIDLRQVSDKVFDLDPSLETDQANNTATLKGDDVRLSQVQSSIEQRPYQYLIATMPGRLQDKVALITGAGSGFGEAMAHAFVREGAHVLIGDFVVASGERVAADISAAEYPNNGSALFVEHNVTARADWEAALQTAKDRFGRLDVVVNNAGTTYRKQASVGVSEEDFDRVVAVNCKSLYWSVQVVMPYFVAQGKGVYLNTGSVAGSRTRPGQVWYGGTKGFLNTVGRFFSYRVRGAANEVADHARSGRGVRATGHSDQLDRAAEGRDWLAGDVQRHGRYAGRARAVQQDRAAGADVRTARYCQRRGVPRQR